MNAFEQVKASQKVIYTGPTAFKVRFDAVAAEIADVYSEVCGEFIEKVHPEIHERIRAARTALADAWRLRNMPEFLLALESWRCEWLSAINLYAAQPKEVQ